jgi:hypothetical protein
MLREALSNPNPLAVLAMLGFIALFALVVVYVVTDRRRRHNDRMEHLPLEDDRHG